MSPESKKLKVDRSQTEFLWLLAQKIREVGYLELATGIILPILGIFSLGFYISQEQIIGLAGHLFWGRYSINFLAFFDVFIASILTIFVGLNLIKAATKFRAISEDGDDNFELLFAALSDLQRSFFLLYWIVFLTIIFIWVEAIFGNPTLDFFVPGS